MNDSSEHRNADFRDPVAFIRDESPPIPEVRHDLQILQSLRRIVRATDIFSRQLIKQHKITSPQLICLHKVMEAEGVTIAELSKTVFLSPSTIVGIIDRLEARGLVTRIRSKGDRRKVLIHGTQAGRELVHEAPSPLQQALERGLRSLPEDEQRQIVDNFETLVGILELGYLDAAPMLETGVLGATPPPVSRKDRSDDDG